MVGSYTFVLRRRLGFILCLTAVLAPLLFLLLQSRPAEYASQAVLEVGTGTVAEEVIGQPSAYEEPERRAATQADAVTSRPVAKLAAQRLGLEVDQETLTALGSRISADPRPATNYIDVTGTGPTARSARQVTEAFTTAYLEYRGNVQRAELERLEADLTSQRNEAERELAALPASATGEREVLRSRIDNAVRLTEAVRLRMSIDQQGVQLLAEPTDPSEPSNALPPLLTAVASLLGALLVGIGLAFLIDLLRDGLRTRREAEQIAGAPYIATVHRPRERSGRRAHLPSDARALRLGLAAACGGVLPVRTVVVAVPGETDEARDVAALLAEAHATSAVRVVVFADSADDAMPAASLTPAPGGALLEMGGGVVVRESLQPDLWIGAATGGGPDGALFDAPSPEHVLEAADRHFDAVVVVPDADRGVAPETVGHLFEALVLVCRLGRTPSRAVRALVERLEHGQRPPVGVVLTATAPRRLGRLNTGAEQRVPAAQESRAEQRPAPALSASSRVRTESP